MQKKLAGVDDWMAHVGEGMFARFEEEYWAYRDHADDRREDSRHAAWDPSSELQRIGQVIRIARVAAGFSLEASARATGVHPSNLSRIENGKRALRLDELLRIAAAVERPVVELLEEAETQGCSACAAPRRSHVRVCPDSGLRVPLLSSGTFTAPARSSS